MAGLHEVADWALPVREVSGLALRSGPPGPELVAVGDADPVVAVLPLRPGAQPRVYDVGSVIRGDAQLEAVACDQEGCVYLLREDPATVTVLDPSCRTLLRVLPLARKGPAGRWADDPNSAGEGLVLLGDNRLLVAKEKDPPALVAFAPDGDVLVPVTTWAVDDDVLGDVSDIAFAPDGVLHLLSAQSRCIARVAGSLPPDGGQVRFARVWSLPDDIAHPEGLAYAADGTTYVAVDRKRVHRNVVAFR